MDFMQEGGKEKSQVTNKVKSTYGLLLLFFLETGAKGGERERGKVSYEGKMVIFTQNTQREDTRPGHEGWGGAQVTLVPLSLSNGLWWWPLGRGSQQDSGDPGLSAPSGRTSWLSLAQGKVPCPWQGELGGLCGPFPPKPCHDPLLLQS